MADFELNAPSEGSSIPQQRQLLLISLIHLLNAPPDEDPSTEWCRIIVDSSLQWASEPVDEEHGWIYLPEPARARRLGGCLVLTS